MSARTRAEGRGVREVQQRSLEEQRSRLERRANAIRARLLRTIDALDERRHQIAEVSHYTKRVAVPVMIGFVGVAALAAGATFGLRAVARSKRERALGRRIGEALVPVRRALLGEKKPTVAEEVLRRVTISVVTIVAAEVAKRAAKNVFNGRLPSGRTLPQPTEVPRLGVVVVDANGAGRAKPLTTG